MNSTNLIIEETLDDGSFRTIYRGENGIADIGNALERMKTFPSGNRFELWSKAHATSPNGYAPLAFREVGSMEVKISNILKMLIGK